MTKLFFFLTVLLFSIELDRPVITSDCTYKGHKLYGKIQYVDKFPDIKVQVVDKFPDLKVQIVDKFPDKCGEWQIVESFPDIKIQYVDKFPGVK